MREREREGGRERERDTHTQTDRVHERDMQKLSSTERKINRKAIVNETVIDLNPGRGGKGVDGWEKEGLQRKVRTN